MRVLLLLVLILVLCACGGGKETNEVGIRERQVVLEDGRTVVCLTYYQNDIECEWGNE